MRRVVVTGMGAVTPIGIGVENFWNSVKEKRTGFDKITKFDTTGFKASLAEKRGLSGIFPGLFYMAFPPAKNLLRRFPYLKKHPYLLPFAWGQRLCGYLREGPVLGSVKEIVKTGRKRKEILREYGIFGEKRR